MHKLYVYVLFITLCVAGCFVFSADTYAASQTIVISEVQVGTAASASNELIELYNNSDTAVDMTDWCVYYASASSLTNGSKLACFVASGPAVHVFLPARTYALAVSTQFSTANPTFGSDIKFSATLSGVAGHVRVLNAQGVEIDKIGWGATAIAAEGSAPAMVPTNTTLLQRKLQDGLTYIDTDMNSTDFQLASARNSYSYGNLYDMQDVCVNIAGIQEIVPTDYTLDTVGLCNPPPVDICANITGIQITIPAGYMVVNSADCMADRCANIDGLQQEVPIDMDADQIGNCYAHDACENLPGVQVWRPDNFDSTGGICRFSILTPKLTELLPNPTSDDKGHEFIELYNPNDSDIDLTHFRLKIGVSGENLYVFPADATIGAHSYRTFYNSEIGFTLVNTSSQIVLVLSDGTIMDQTDTYISPADGMAWAMVDGRWQYTDQPTPGSENFASVVVEDNESVTSTHLQPCAANQYRSPETNRCRTTALLTSVLTPCKDGQYRSEETNRCRSISAVLSSVKSCDDDQFRNPTTGRCKKIASSDELAVADCGEGRERNPTSGRCRNVAASSVPEASFAVEPVKETGKAFIGWWTLGGVGVLALGYGGWEWRQEVMNMIRKIISSINPDS